MVEVIEKFSTQKNRGEGEGGGGDVPLKKALKITDYYYFKKPPL